jgi:hypothetical protein
VSYLRFTREEFQAIRRACDLVDLSDDFFTVFKAYLVELLSDTLPILAIRIARFRIRQLELLYRCLRRQKASQTKNQGHIVKSGPDSGLTCEELQAIRRASGPFFLFDGSLHSYQEYLVYSFVEARPGLAAKLARLHPRQITRLYRQAKKRSRWNV